MSTPAKRCGKRKNAEFPFTTDEMKKKLIENVDRLKVDRSKTQIRQMQRKTLCKYFSTRSKTSLKFNLALVKKKGSVKVVKVATKSPKRKSKTPKSKTPKKKSKTPKKKSKTPEKKKSKTMSKSSEKEEIDDDDDKITIKDGLPVDDDGSIMFFTKVENFVNVENARKILKAKDLIGAKKVIDQTETAYFDVEYIDLGFGESYREKHEPKWYFAADEGKNEITMLNVLEALVEFSSNIKAELKKLLESDKRQKKTNSLLRIISMKKQNDMWVVKIDIETQAKRLKK